MEVLESGEGEVVPNLVHVLLVEFVPVVDAERLEGGEALESFDKGFALVIRTESRFGRRQAEESESRRNRSFPEDRRGRLDAAAEVKAFDASEELMVLLPSPLHLPQPLSLLRTKSLRLKAVHWHSHSMSSIDHIFDASFDL